jgi:hypothetical protein
MAAKVVGPSDGKAGFLGSIGVRFMIDGDEGAVASRWWSTRCLHGHLPRHCTGTRAKTSTATSWREHGRVAGGRGAGRRPR